MLAEVDILEFLSSETSAYDHYINNLSKFSDRLQKCVLLRSSFLRLKSKVFYFALLTVVLCLDEAGVSTLLLKAIVAVNLMFKVLNWYSP